MRTHTDWRFKLLVDDMPRIKHAHRTLKYNISLRVANTPLPNDAYLTVKCFDLHIHSVYAACVCCMQCLLNQALCGMQLKL